VALKCSVKKSILFGECCYVLSSVDAKIDTVTAVCVQQVKGSWVPQNITQIFYPKTLKFWSPKVACEE